VVLKTLLVGIDVGTTSVKTVLMDRDGFLLAQASHEYATEYPLPTWAQQNPQDWWRAVCHTLQQVFADSKARPESVAGVGVSARRRP
jgi:xylulokinase